MQCSYCGEQIPKGTGTIYVSKIGKISNYCSRRCIKYASMKRNVSVAKERRVRKK